MNKNDKILINKFFDKMHYFIELFNNAEKKWEVLPECNSLLQEMYEIGKEISIDNENLEKIILDLESMIVMQRNDDSILSRYKDFIKSFS